LVKQAFAQIDGAPRTFINKCHGGHDSLVTARETYEIARRFLFGDVRVRLKLLKAEITRGFDLIGRSEFFLGVSIKPRGTDFDLFHQSRDAENCYGPFRSPALDDVHDPEDAQKGLAFPWAGEGRLIWEGWLDSGFQQKIDAGNASPDMVMRLDVYVGERDIFGIGFSDNLVFGKQYYVRAQYDSVLNNIDLFCHVNERFEDKPNPEIGKQMTEQDGGWNLEVFGTGFEATFRIELDFVPEEGPPTPFDPAPQAAPKAAP
jgi:hypothetical protein